MKIGIITLHGYFNYGNRLQNFALQEVLKELNHDVETIVIKKRENKLKEYIKNIIKKNDNRYTLRPINDIIREKNIKRFSCRFINTKFYKEDVLNKKNIINSNYDMFIVGSDQVWNPKFWQECTKTSDFRKNFLTFAEDKKRLSYAASFGISELPEFWQKPMGTELKKFSAISVREESGAAIIKKIANVDATVVLDPTMLLTDTQWSEKLKLTNNKQDYILCFFLGKREKKEQDYIENLSKHEKIIDLMNIMDRRYYCSNPIDFLNYIKNAKAVLTDSFHATVFSLIFKTPFIVFGRNYNNKMNMNSRIETLLEKFNLKNRIYSNKEIDLYSCDFSYFEKLIENERNNSLRFLEDSLKINNL